MNFIIIVKQNKDIYIELINSYNVLLYFCLLLDIVFSVKVRITYHFF